MFLFSGCHNSRSGGDTPADPWAALLDRVADGLMVRTDSRRVKPGEVFVAVRGVNVDGTQFIPAALDNGAAVIVVDKPVTLPEGMEAECIERPDASLALGDLARAHFGTDKLDLKLVGVTGTNGKTTVSFIIEHLLTASGLNTGMMGTVVYRWPGFNLDAKLTTPDCWTLHELLSNMASTGVEATVMEVSSHALSQNRVAGLKFDLGVWTNLTQDHLDYHPDMEDYFQAKARLFKTAPRAGKLGIINFNDPYGRRLMGEYSPTMGYGLADPDIPHGTPESGSLAGEVLSMDADGLTLRMTYGDQTWELASPLIGLHNAQNLLAAQSVGLGLGLGPKDMLHLQDFAGVPGRLERVINPHGLNAFVDYAHTPDALENVLRALKPLAEGRLICVFGCGGDRDKTKRPIMAEAVAKGADVAVLTSDNPRFEDPLDIIADARPGLGKGAAESFEEADRAKALKMAVGMMRKDDILLVAGKGHETYQQVGDNFLDFSDVTETARAMEELRR